MDGEKSDILAGVAHIVQEGKAKAQGAKRDLDVGSTRGTILLAQHVRFETRVRRHDDGVTHSSQARRAPQRRRQSIEIQSEITPGIKANAK